MKTKCTHPKWMFLTIFWFFTQATNILASANTSWPFTLNCPPNVYVSCTDELWNLSIYGNATYTIGNHTYSAGHPTIKYFLNNCNTGYITRTWTVEDNHWQWHTCTQTIFVSSTGNGAPQITWPKDVELEGCNPNTHPDQLPLDSRFPTWTPNECRLLARSYSDKIFTVNSQCKKVMRTWKVLDWCTSSGNNSTFYTHVQILYLINNTVPDFNCPKEIAINSTNCKDAVLIVNPLTLEPSICGGNFEITNNSSFATSKGNNISGTYPIGTTTVHYTLKYACGKTKTCTTKVIVKNASAPTVYCIGKLSTALMPVDTDGDGKVDDGMVELWAKDFNKGSLSKCGHHPLKFSFSKDVNETNKTFTCENIGKNEVQMWVTDSKGAQSYCIVELTIQNNSANIPDCHPTPIPPVIPTYQLKGTVTSLTDQVLKDVQVDVRSKNAIITYTSTYDTTEVLQLDSFINFSGHKLYRYLLVKKIVETKDSTIQYLKKSATTNILGQYQVDSVSFGRQAIEISASYQDPPRQFIDHNDVQLLTKYLLGEFSFSSYQQFLASDINEDSKVNVEDQNILLSFVNGQINTLPGSHQWYLVDAKAQYAKPEDVFKAALPTRISLDSIQKYQPAINFVAIKKGNISIDPGSFQETIVAERAATKKSLHVVVYPNPCYDDVQFQMNAEKDDHATLQLFNMAGQLVKTQRCNLSKGQNTIPLSLLDQKPGSYMYRLQIGQQINQGSLIKIE